MAVYNSKGGGSNRISNLTLSCRPCNEKKGNQTASEFGHPKVEAQAKNRYAVLLLSMPFAGKYGDALKPLG